MGFIPFEYELTKYIHTTGKNVIAVKADHSEFADSRWYTGSGIYRNVYLIATNKMSIDLWGVAFSTYKIANGKTMAKVAVSLTDHSSSNSDVLVRCILIDKDGKQVAQAQQIVKTSTGNTSAAHINFPINDPVFWAVEQPELYKLETGLIYQWKKNR